jgi:hypothetical protein
MVTPYRFFGSISEVYMKFFLASFLIASLSISAALAATTPTKPRQTYPATEEGPSQEVVSSAPGYNGTAPLPQAEPESSDAAAAAAAAQTKKATAPQAAPAAVSKGFDLVPTNQTEPLIRRLKLAETLVMKYGRAYDYRAMTVLELQGILDKLDAEAKRETQARVDERMRSQAVIRAEASATNTSPEALQETHDSIGSEAPEAQPPAPPAPAQMN